MVATFTNPHLDHPDALSVAIPWDTHGTLVIKQARQPPITRRVLKVMRHVGFPVEICCRLLESIVYLAVIKRLKINWR